MSTHVVGKYQDNRIVLLRFLPVCCPPLALLEPFSAASTPSSSGQRLVVARGWPSVALTSVSLLAMALVLPGVLLVVCPVVGGGAAMAASGGVAVLALVSVELRVLGPLVPGRYPFHVVPAPVLLSLPSP